MRIREEEEVRMQRLAESAAMAEWTAKEGDWALEQERKRAAIRIKEKRAKAIDFLALNLRYATPRSEEEEDEELDEAGLEIDLDEPYNIFDVCYRISAEPHNADSLYRTWLRHKPRSCTTIYRSTLHWSKQISISTSGRWVCITSRASCALTGADTEHDGSLQGPPRSHPSR
jgi:hypothetical protein